MNKLYTIQQLENDVLEHSLWSNKARMKFYNWNSKLGFSLAEFKKESFIKDLKKGRQNYFLEKKYGMSRTYTATLRNRLGYPLIKRYTELEPEEIKEIAIKHNFSYTAIYEYEDIYYKKLIKILKHLNLLDWFKENKGKTND